MEEAAVSAAVVLEILRHETRIQTRRETKEAWELRIAKLYVRDDQPSPGEESLHLPPPPLVPSVLADIGRPCSGFPELFPRSSLCQSVSQQSVADSLIAPMKPKGAISCGPARSPREIEQSGTAPLPSYCDWIDQSRGVGRTSYGPARPADCGWTDQNRDVDRTSYGPERPAAIRPTALLLGS